MSKFLETDYVYDTSGKLTSTGSANAYVVTISQQIAGYYQGLGLRFKANFTNTGSATINVQTQNAPSGLGAVTLKKFGGTTNLVAGDIVSGGEYTVVHDGTNAQVLELNTGILPATSSLTVSATSRVIGRKTAGAGAAEELTASEVLDFIGTEAQGDILYRAASAWALLAAGTAGQSLVTGGAAANPSWGGGITTIASGSVGTSTVFDITSIPQHYAGLYLILSGLSSDTAARAVRLFASDNNGSSFNTTSYAGIMLVGGSTPAAYTAGFIDPGNLTNAADGLTAGVLLFGYQVNNRQIAAGFTSASGGGNRISLSRCTSTGAMNALRLAWDASGNFDAGTYTLIGLS
jgi:hypothetical protein